MANVFFGTLFVISTFSMSLFSQVAAFNPSPYRTKLAAMKNELEIKRQSATELDKKIQSCRKKPRGNSNCDGILNGNMTNDEIAAWKEELRIQNSDIVKMEADLAKEQSKARVVEGNGIVEIEKVKLEARHLLMNNAMLRADLSGQISDINSIMAAVDKTLIGEYTHYAIDQALKGNKICEAVASCADVKKSKGKIDALEKKVKSFQQFRDEQLKINASQAAPKAPDVAK